jgi:Dyp-type peroxidase family
VAAAPVTLELGDVQGLVARGYGTLAAASFLLLGLEDGEAARRWLGSVAGSVTSGDDRPEGRAVNLAFTAAGLTRLGLPDEMLQQFSNEFVHGMTTEHRRRILGDVGASAPEHWDWGGASSPSVGAVLLLYARDASELSRLLEEQSRLLVESGVEVQRKLGTSDLDGFEPFGFRDGISQPFVEGLSKSGPEGQTVRAGEFVLGYVNEHGHYTDEPLVEDGIGKNGSYLVFRQLEQDVRGFWRYIDAAVPHPAERIRLAAKMVGRWPGGAPLALSPDRDDPSLADANDFGYHHEDPVGTGCPVGAHVRRTNPRDSLDPSPGTDKSLAINRRHRLLRRGREYGQALSPDAALAESLAPDEQRGLHFICLNGNISRQFEFVQNTWLNSPKFAGLYDDSDPLVGQSDPYGGTFTMPSAAGARARVTGMPRFITVKGGAYFFLPGLTALRRLAS